jgi:hypothetical protein
VPLSALQHRILSLIARHRDPESFVAGGTVLNREGARYSDDIDIFNDVLERVEQAALKDAEALTTSGLAVSWIRRGPGFFSATIADKSETTKIEWVHDSDFRFYPAVPDDVFGYMLHPVDLAVNKVAAAADRSVARDMIDLLTVHDRVLSLGAAVLAAVGRAMGWTPEGMLAEMLRHVSSISRQDYAQLATATPFDIDVAVVRLRAIIGEADDFVRRMPPGSEGALFLLDGRPVLPDPAHLDRYAKHVGKRRGHWPSSSDIGSAMLERYVKPT